MKIIRMKKKKDLQKRDMFAVLCLLQAVSVILIIFILFIFTKINDSAISQIRSDLSVIFGSDFDIGGYFTSSEKNEAAATENAISAQNTYDEITISVMSNAQAQAASDEASEPVVVMPASGTVTSDFGYREHPVYSGESFHSGRDIAASQGSAVYAVTDGVVTQADEAQKAGKYIKILHADGRETLYCHCSELLVEKGDSVKTGEVIALVGQTGLATGPHLHFELHENGEAVDPEKILSGAVSVY